jgi:hypothetical protein
MPQHVVPLLLVLLSGCASLALGGADRSALRSATLVEECPLGVPWTQVRLEDAGDDIELIFKTTSSRVDELRRRVRDQARASGPNSHLGPGHDGEHGGPRDHGLRLWAMGPVKTHVADTPNGAKLAVAPVDPSRRAELRDLLAQRVAHLEATDCPE